MIVNQSNYKQVVRIINQMEYCQQLKLLEDIKRIIGYSNKKKKTTNTWIGALSGKTKILGDIVAPVIGEDEWEVLST
jgi:hypothetical protein